MTDCAWDLLEHRVRHRPAEPLLTFVADNGARTELSAITLANNVAKAANALRDEALLDPGARVSLHIPWHWQRAVWALACWAVDATVVPFGAPDDAALVLAGPEQAPALVGGTEVWVVSLHPFGLPNASVPPGSQDAATIARAQPDAFAPWGPCRSTALGSDDQGALIARARTMSVARRFAVAGEPPTVDAQLLLPTLVPLVHDASIVMVEGSDQAAAIAAQESAELIG